MTEYSAALNPFLLTLFPPQSMADILGEVVGRAGLAQLRMAETEKYPHVTYFLNGGEETPFPGEERIMVPSPRWPPTTCSRRCRRPNSPPRQWRRSAPAPTT
jgi:2,3-bisphosphoglycerate-independent phosphoglycerate mutase